MTIEDRRRESQTSDYLIRSRILKLRWMGLDQEADLLADDWKMQIAQYGAIHPDHRHTD